MSKQIILALPSEKNTENLAAELSLYLTSPLILAFSGEIGAGKTTFIRAMLRVLGIQTAIKSPTFSLVETYECQGLLIHHFDLYRIHDPTELEYVGFRDYFSQNAICCIEWPERASYCLAFTDIHFVFAINGNERSVTVDALTPAGKKILAYLADNP